MKILSQQQTVINRMRTIQEIGFDVGGLQNRQRFLSSDRASSLISIGY